jgi:hypothetical protein
MVVVERAQVAQPFLAVRSWFLVVAATNWKQQKRQRRTARNGCATKTEGNNANREIGVPGRAGQKQVPRRCARSG